MVCKTHYGHEISLAHLRIPEKDRLAIAEKLTAGVEFQRILDDVRDSIGDTCKRIHLLTRKYLNNIEKAYILFKTEDTRMIQLVYIYG